MKTIKYKEIDGYKIIIGFDQLPTDTAASMINAEPKIKELPEYKELENKAREKEEHFRRATEAKGKARLALIGKTDAEKDANQFNLSKKLYQEYLKQDKEYKDRAGAAGVCDNELKEINSRLKPLAKDVRRQNLIYAEPRRNEVLATPEQVTNYMQDFCALDDNEKLSIEIDETGNIVIDSAEIVPDFRECQYFFYDGNSWIESEIITVLGVTVSTVVVDEYEDQAIEKTDLTPEQLKEVRFQGLNAEEKTAEYEQKKTGLAGQAASLENSLKFDGVADYADQAQTWYDSELSALKSTYDVLTQEIK